MSTWTYFLWLSRQAADGLLFMWPITAGLLSLLLIAVVRSRGDRSSNMRGGWWLQLAPLGIPVAVLVWVLCMFCENCSPSPLGQGVRHLWAGHVVDALLVLQLVGAIWLV
jgi:hypothetical protein